MSHTITHDRAKRSKPRSLELVLQAAYARLEIALGLDVESWRWTKPASVERAGRILQSLDQDLATFRDSDAALVDLVLLGITYSMIGALAKLRDLRHWQVPATESGRAAVIAELRETLEGMGLPRSILKRLPHPSRGSRAKGAGRWAA